VERIKKKGVALIAVIVTIVLFTSLILAVVLAATMSIRRANYYKDKLIALEIAENGLQKILYNMNYVAYDYGYYPFGWSDQSNIQKETEIDSGIGKVTIKIDPDNVGADTKILAIGSYRGRIAKISCEIRSDSEIKLGDKLNDGATSETQAIPEAFNKHVIYASQVSGIGTTVKGNITYANTSSTPPGQVTFTQTNNFSIPILKNYTPKDADFTPPTDPTPGSWNKRFKDDDGSGASYTGAAGYEPYLPAGVSYSGNGTDETYTIDAATIGNEKWIFERAASNSLTVKITGTSSMGSDGVVKSGDTTTDTAADIVLDFSGTNNPNIQGKLIAKRNITINGGTGSKNPVGTSGTTTLFARNISIDYTGGTGPVINGDIGWSGGMNQISLKSGANKIQINGNVYAAYRIMFENNSNTIDGIKINGDVIAGMIFFTNTNSGYNFAHSLNAKGTIQSDAGANFKLDIDSSSSSKKAGIVLYSPSDGTLSLVTQNTDTINIKIGDNQVAGILIYFDNVTQGGTGKNTYLNLRGTINFNSPPNRVFLINHSEIGDINIIPSNPVASPLTGSIYSAFYKDTNQTINFNGNVKGSIITNGTVNLNGGSLIYDPAPYKDSTGSVFRGFVGGRRKYLPVPGSWRIEW